MKKVNLTESDLTRIISKVINEQTTGNEPTTGDTQSYKLLVKTIVRFHPELKAIDPNVGKAVEFILKDGKFNVANMRKVCRKTPEFCKVAFTTPEVMDELFKVLG